MAVKRIIKFEAEISWFYTPALLSSSSWQRSRSWTQPSPWCLADNASARSRCSLAFSSKRWPLRAADCAWCRLQHQSPPRVACHPLGQEPNPLNLPVERNNKILSSQPKCVKHTNKWSKRYSLQCTDNPVNAWKMCICLSLGLWWALIFHHQK